MYVFRLLHILLGEVFEMTSVQEGSIEVVVPINVQLVASLRLLLKLKLILLEISAYNLIGGLQLTLYLYTLLLGSGNSTLEDSAVLQLLLIFVTKMSSREAKGTEGVVLFIPSLIVMLMQFMYILQLPNLLNYVQVKTASLAGTSFRILKF